MVSYQEPQLISSFLRGRAKVVFVSPCPLEYFYTQAKRK